MYKLNFRETSYDGDYNTVLSVDHYFSYLGDAIGSRNQGIAIICDTMEWEFPTLPEGEGRVSLSFMDWNLEQIDLIDAIDCNIIDLVDHGDGWKTFTVGGSVDKMLQSFESIDSIIIYNREDGREDPIDGSYKFGFVCGSIRGFVTLYDEDEFESSICYQDKNFKTSNSN